MGSVWIGLSNLLAVSVLGFVYKFVFSIQNFSSYLAYLAIGVTLWGFLSGCPLACSGVFQATRNRSLNSEFTPSFFLLEEFTFQVFNFAIAFAPILLIGLGLGLIPLTGLVFSIIPFINLFLFVFFVSCLLSLVGAKYKDIGMLFPVLFQLMFLTSPIMFYKESMGKSYILAKFNPFYRFLDSVRGSIVYNHFPHYTAIFCFVILVFLSIFSYRLVVQMRNKIILWY